jgi:hypothetical protein
MNARIVVVLAALAVIGGCATPGARSSVAAPRATPATGVLTILTNVPGAEIYIDGDHRADAIMRPTGDVAVACYSLNHTLPAGKHNIVVRAAGYATYKTTVRIGAGNQQPLLVRLIPLEGPKAMRLRQARTWETVNPWTGAVILTVERAPVSPEGARVYLDGRMVGEIVRGGEQTPIIVPLGDHMITVRHAGAKPYVAGFCVTQGNPVRLFVALQPATPSRPAARIESTGDTAE